MASDLDQILLTRAAKETLGSRKTAACARISTRTGPADMARGRGW
jgi:hypothetical protein